MTPAEISSHINSLRIHYKELEIRLSDPEIFSKQNEYKEVSREHQKLTSLLKDYDRWVSAVEELEENKLLVQSEEDEDMQAMISSDIKNLEDEINKLEGKVRILLMPPDPNDDKDIIVEIRPAAGGDEAALFAGDLYRAYTRFAEIKGWKQEVLDFSGSSLGGIKEVIFSLVGDDVYSIMKYEFGVHRVQRIPTTESGGRIHTSTITVSVLPEAEDVELEVREEDLRYDYFRSSGPGGQCVNTTDSAVRVTHMPTGVSVASQQEKSQHRNKATALRILKAKLLEVKQQEEAAKQADSKRAQIGTGDRSERIRTYNFPQNRVTDHRFGISIYDLPSIMSGEMTNLFEQIMSADSEKTIEELLKK
ncbi:MAG TPA: peptide chain release factor 1 [Victivallales bacterium]|nr:peptide chain release factor 1 [Victivallales bacterium]